MASIATMNIYPTRITGAIPKPRRVRRNSPPTPKVVQRLLDLLDLLGIEAEETRAAWGRYRELMRQQPDDLATAAADTDHLADELASGGVSPAQAAKAVAKSDPADVADTRARLASVLSDARDQALADTVNSLRDLGEQHWLDTLRPIIAASIEDPRDPDAARKFEAAYELAHAVLVKPEGARPLTSLLSEQRFGKPAEPYWSRIEGAKFTKVISEGTGKDRVQRRELSPKGGRRISLGVVAAHPEWEPGLYSAEEAVANVKAALAEEDRQAEELVAKHERLSGKQSRRKAVSV